MASKYELQFKEKTSVVVIELSLGAQARVQYIYHDDDDITLSSENCIADLSEQLSMIGKDILTEKQWINIRNKVREYLNFRKKHSKSLKDSEPSTPPQKYTQGLAVLWIDHSAPENARPQSHQVAPQGPAGATLESDSSKHNGDQVERASIDDTNDWRDSIGAHEVEQILENQCAFSAYQIETCLEKLVSGERNLVPGERKVPKGFNFVDKENGHYYAPILSINIFETSEKDRLTISGNGTIGVAFNIENYGILVFSLGRIKKTEKDLNVRFYAFNEFEQYRSEESSPLVMFKFEDRKVTLESTTPLSNVADRLLPAMNYYSSLAVDLLFNTQSAKNNVDLDLLRRHYNEFQHILLDESKLLLPVLGKAEHIKRGISVIITDADGIISTSHYPDVSVDLLSRDDYNLYIESFQQQNIKIKRESLCVLRMDDLSDREIRELKKQILGDSTDRFEIIQNVEGERARLTRIIRGIQDAAGEVSNSYLVDILSKNNISYEISEWAKQNKYTPNKNYIEFLKREYPLLKTNPEQLMALDKIIQMEANNIDVELVQGPPGTGKTELILSLAKELNRKGLNILITSNVHVACDNIVERFKNNRDIVLKRYTSLKGEKYIKERRDNQKSYIQNQVLAGFQFVDLNGEIQNLSGKSTYDMLLQLNEHLCGEKNKLLAQMAQYDDQLEQYKSLTLKVRATEQTLKDISGKCRKEAIICLKQVALILQLRDALQKINLTRQELDAQIASQNNELTNFKAAEKFHIRKYSELNDEKKKLNSIITSDEKKKTELEELISKLRQNIILIDAQKRQIESIDKAALKKTVSDKITKQQCIDPEYKRYLEDISSEIDFLCDIYHLLINDTAFWDGNSDVSAAVVEFLYYNSQKNTLSLKRYNISQEIIDSLGDIYQYYRVPESTKKRLAMRLPLFSKINGKNYSYFRSKIDELNVSLKRFKYLLQDYISALIDSCNFEQKRQDLLKQLEDELDNFNEENQEYSKQINLLSEEISNIKSQQLPLVEDNINCEMDNLQKSQKLHKQAQIGMAPLQKRAQEIQSSINEYHVQLSEQQKIFSLHKEESKELYQNYIASQQEQVELKNELAAVYQEKKEVILNYDSYLEKIEKNLELVDDEISKVRKTIDLMSEKTNFLMANGWNASEAQQLIFDYVSELGNIVSTDDMAIQNYLMGRGDVFNRIFDPKNTSSGSIVSMTTSQVAQLFTETTDLSFDYAIVDEASKCKFEDLIISLPHIKHLVLIGDFMQLDPIYTRYEVLDMKYQVMFTPEEWDFINKSPFSELLSQFVSYNEKHKIMNFDGNPYVAVMKRQYRMNKGIFDIIEPIYEIHKGFELIDEKRQVAHDFQCIQIDGNEIQPDGDTSYYNDAEVDAIFSFLSSFYRLRNQFPHIKSIGIITGYRLQERQIRKKIASIFKTLGKLDANDYAEKIYREVKIGTFDRFQGREFDLVLVSLVRTEKFGFTSDIRRMNVAFSRAKNHLLVFGNIEALYRISQSKTKVLDDAISEEQRAEEIFVKEKLIPQLYDRRQSYVSSQDLTESLLDFIREDNE